MLLTDLADAARTSGLRVIELKDWATRSRPASTGSFEPFGVLCHHTGSEADGLDYAWSLATRGRSDLPPPLCQLALGHDGTVYVCAAGRANHGGTARAAGPMPSGDANTLYVGIEAMNTGSEGWSTTQRDAYVRLCAALCRWYGWPATHVRAHRETSVTGKWDPGLLDMDRFRSDIHTRMEDEPMSPEDKTWIADQIRESMARVPTRDDLSRALDGLVTERMLRQAIRKEIGNARISDPTGEHKPYSLGRLVWAIHNAATKKETEA